MHCFGRNGKLWYWEMSLMQSFVVKVCFLEYHCVVEKYLVSETITLFTKNKSFKEGRTKPTNHIAVQKKACQHCSLAEG